MIILDNYVEPEYRINAGKGIIIGRTEIMLNLFDYLNHLAKLSTTVSLRGETGTGKELCARALHYNGDASRGKHEFVIVNCAGIPSELLESELFGYVKGAFTGAYRDTKGKFQHANGGTIFLDEIGDMPPPLQAKILRVIQEKQVIRVGSNKTENIDVRIITATNSRLEDKIKSGEFREDLYYRLNVIPVTVPPLRERKDDIVFLADHFIKRYNEIYGVNLQGLSDDAHEKLMSLEWKGNVRELGNILERVFTIKKGGIITSDDLYFNSDMPKRISFSDWFKNGVFPTSITELTNKYNLGIKPDCTLRRLEKNQAIHSVRLSTKKQCQHLVFYITPETIDLFFYNINTEDYKALKRRFSDDNFNQIVNHPFALFTASDLIANPYTVTAKRAINFAAQNSGVYKFSIGHVSCFAITENNSIYFIPKGAGREERNFLFQKNFIKPFYEKFRRNA